MQNGHALNNTRNPTFQNGVGFDNGNGLSGEQGFAIGGQERLSRQNGYLSELAAAAFVCRVSSSNLFASLEYFDAFQSNANSIFCFIVRVVCKEFIC